MKLKAISLLAAAAAMLLPLSEVKASPDRQAYKTEKGDVAVARTTPGIAHGNVETRRYREGELLVKFKPGVAEGAKQAKHKKLQSQVLREHKGLRLHHLKLKKGMTVEEALAQYQADPDVEYAEPNFEVSLQNTPNDALRSLQWGMEKISAPAAWDLTTGDGNAVIAVLDTGIDYTHPDLVANLWVNQGELNGQPNTDNDGDGYPNDVYGYNATANNGDPMDDQSHGTLVAGTIGAVGNNGIGVAGMAWNVKLMACKFINSDAFGTIGDAIECLQYVKAMKARGVNIVATNNSWGSNFYSQSLFDAIRDTKDILFVAAAGNDNNKLPFYPSGYNLPNIISVAASDKNDQKASFSNYNKWAVDIAAPGVSIESTFPGGDYLNASGTSIAAPHVAGLAALLNMQTPSRTTPQLKNLILAGGDQLASFADITVSGRRINAYQSLTCSNSQLFAIIDLPTSPQVGVPQTVSAISINCGNPVGPVSATLSGGGSIALSDDGVAPDEVAGDGIFTGTWTPTGTSTERLTFSSPAGTSAVSVPPVTIADQPAIAAPAKQLPNTVTSANINTPFSQTFTASGGIPPFSWSLAKGALPAGLSVNALTGEISGTPSAAGIYPITVKVTDNAGVADLKEWTLLMHDGLRPGWPKELHQRQGTGFMPETFSPIMADLDGDGRDEIIVSDITNNNIFQTESPLYVFYPDGTSRSVMLPGIVTSPAVADLDGDGAKEIIVTVRYHLASPYTVYAFHADLTPVSGFPAGSYNSYNGGPGASFSPTVADFNNDGEPEIAVLTSPNNTNDPNYGKNVLLMVDGSGATMPGWPQIFGSSNNADGFPGDDTPPALGDMDDDGIPELVVASPDGYLRIFRGDGTILREWQFEVNPRDTYTPVLADLDGDGHLDVVVKYGTSTSDSVLKVFDRNGTVLPGWPKPLTGNAPSTPVVADMDGDGVPEIVLLAGSFWNEIHVLHGDGSYLAGWPVSFAGGSGINGHPIVADIDGDGQQEILVAAQDDTPNGMVRAFTAAGAAVSGFPKYASPLSQIRTSALLGDVDANGRLDLAVKSEDGFLYVWELPQDATGSDLQWPMYRKDVQHSGTYWRNALEVKPGDHNFQSVGTDGSATWSFLVRNPMSVSATASVALSGADSGMFSVTPGSCGALPVTLNPGQSCAVDVAFSPSSIGAKSAVLEVQSSGMPTVTASLAGTGTPPSHTLSYSATGAGSGTVAGPGWTWSGSGSRAITEGTVVSLTPTAAIDSVFSGWTGCDSVSGNVCTVTMTGDRSVSASFSIKTLTVTATVAFGGGSIAPPSSAVSYGGAVTVTVTPAEGEDVSSFLDNGSPAGLTPAGNGSYSYTISSVTADHLLSVSFRSPSAIVGVSAGAYHTLTLLGDGTVWSSGYNYYGQLGDGSTSARSLPMLVQGLTGVNAIAAGSNFSVALKSDGTVWCWGKNNYGQLGDGSATNRSTPVQVAGLSGVVAIGAGADHALAVKGDGTVWAWGYNFYGQLGDDTAPYRSSASMVSGLAGVTAVAGGSSHSVARTGDGAVWTWGYNGSGQLGDGSYSSRFQPQQVPGLSEVAAIAAAYGHSEAVKSDGTVYSWGYNVSRQAGDGSAASRTSPEQVAGLSGVVALAAGQYHLMALKSDGTVWGWGNNRAGNLGDGSSLHHAEPVRAAELTGVAAVAAGASHSMAVKQDNTLWGWGQNTEGEIGNGTTISSSTRSVVRAFGNVSGPAASVTGAPQAPTSVTSATLSVGGTGVVSYKFKVDAGSYSPEIPVTDPIELVFLAEGTHVVSVVGKDGDGNWQSAPTTAGWAVDLTPPTVTLTGAPAVTKVGAVTLNVIGNDVVGYKYKLDGGNYSLEKAVTVALSLSSLADGSHTVSVIGKDSAGNWQSVPTQAGFLVDQTAPVTTISPAPGVITPGDSVSLTCSDGAGTGCATTLYCLGAYCTPDTAYTGPIALPGAIEVRYSSSDLAGNSETVKTASYTVPGAADYAVTVSVKGAGAGAVVSTPAGISTSGSATARFSTGTTVTLRATPAQFSFFLGWSGSCSGTGDCVLKMTADAEANANFARDSAYTTRIPKSSAIYSPTIQGAYDASADSDSIQVWGVALTENVLFSADKRVLLSGGYNQSFDSQDGSTILNGSLTVTNGRVSIDRVTLR